MSFFCFILQKVFILYEHALGYALFRVKVKSGESSNSVEALNQLAQELLNNEEEFLNAFKLHAFAPFTSSASALQNCNGISEGIVPIELKAFIEENLPSSSNVLLCVADRKLAESIKDPEIGLSENITCSSESLLHEVYRALRVYFPKYINVLSHFDESKAQIGLGHSYSRAKVKFNIYRVKEWFSYHFPELTKIVPDNATFVKVVRLIRTRDGASEENLEALAALTDTQVASDIIESAKSSVATFTEKITSLIERRRLTQDYLAKKLVGVAPNLSTMIGDRVSARLIAHAGSLTNLAKFPASTIQVLGAEKALFRALKTHGSTPKYGLIYHSPFITRASKENKGRISRFLAAKCAIASRIDCFSEVLCDIYGKHLKQQIEDRLNYFETGTAPPTNAEAMARAITEVNKYILRMKKKAIKTLNKRDSDSQEETEEVTGTEGKKKKKKKRETITDGTGDHETAEEKVNEVHELSTHMNGELNDAESKGVAKKKKKKKRHNSESAGADRSMNGSLIETAPKKLPSGRKRSASESSVVLADKSLNSVKKKKKIHMLNNSTF
ncbi:unnamed protein product [Trichobilharzia regenti]|nr:unnamed protein product [Trichobilharzia regenti]